MPVIARIEGQPRDTTRQAGATICCVGAAQAIVSPMTTHMPAVTLPTAVVATRHRHPPLLITADDASTHPVQ